MPEPDFDQIARSVSVMSCEACAAKMRRTPDGLHYDDARGGATWGVCRTVVAKTQIAEQLRLVWNARGAADIAKVEATLYADGTSRTGFDKMLDQAIRGLDR